MTLRIIIIHNIKIHYFLASNVISYTIVLLYFFYFLKSMQMRIDYLILRYIKMYLLFLKATFE